MGTVKRGVFSLTGTVTRGWRQAHLVVSHCTFSLLLAGYQKVREHIQQLVASRDNVGHFRKALGLQKRTAQHNMVGKPLGVGILCLVLEANLPV